VLVIRIDVNLYYNEAYLVDIFDKPISKGKGKGKGKGKVVSVLN
jgi:hypothetical protein